MVVGRSSSLTRAAGIISNGSHIDRPRFRSAAVSQNAYHTSMHNHLEFGLSGSLTPAFIGHHVPLVDIVRHAICFGDVQDMGITISSAGLNAGML